MASCDTEKIKIETPFIIYGRNYTGQFVSRIHVADDIESLELADDEGLFRLEPIYDGAYYELTLYKCNLINAQACECPVINELKLRVNHSEETCTLPIYTVIPGHVENAATEANTYGKQLVLDFNMLPVVDENGNTPCDNEFDPSTADMDKLLDYFHVLFENEGDKVAAEHSSFETRFCQMFYQSIKIQPRYKVKELFAPGDILTLKYKDGVDKYGNDTYYVIDKAKKYMDGGRESDKIKVKYVQNDNTLTLESPVDIDVPGFPIDVCHNEFIVEASRSSCTELQLYDGSSKADVPVYEIDWENNQIKINLMKGMFPVDEQGRETCGKSRIVLSGKGCNDTEAAYRVDFPVIRYVYDGSNFDGKYTTGANCIYVSPIELNTDDDPSNVNAPMKSYGKDMYVKIRDAESCCKMKYISVKVKYNEYLQHKYGELVLNGIQLQENDLVWLTSQFDKDSPDDDTESAKAVSENGLWVVKKTAWEYYGPVTEDMFIDLGARVTETVSATIDTNVGRRYGNYWIGSVNLRSGMIVNLQNQEDGQDGLYRIMCGDWKYLGKAGPYSGNSIDMSNDIVTYNDIDFCKCGIYHIWYYYLNGSCVLNTATRTVKVVGKCGPKEGTLVPGKRIRITDYQIKTEVDKELMPGSSGDPLIDECVRNVESFDKQYRFDVEDIVLEDTCISGAVLPDCNEGTLCDHEYGAFSKGENDKYNSSDYSGFSIVFWQADMDDDRVGSWTMYALVGRTSKNPKEYVAYRLHQVGAATAEMVNVTDWFELLAVSSTEDSEPVYYREVPISYASVAAAMIKFDVPTDGKVDTLQVGDVVDVSNGNVLEDKLKATVSRIDNNEATALVSLPAGFDKDAYHVELYHHQMVGEGIKISDPSWVFSGTADYPMKYKSTVEDKDYYTLVVPASSPLTVGNTYYAYSNKGQIRPIPFTIEVDTQDEESITYTACLSHKVPTYDVIIRHVENGELVETVEKKRYPIRVAVGNELTWRTITENWAIKSNSTKISIPKSYDFRFYDTPISVQEFVDLYNAIKPTCIDFVE